MPKTWDKFDSTGIDPEQLAKINDSSTPHKDLADRIENEHNRDKHKPRVTDQFLLYKQVLQYFGPEQSATPKVEHGDIVVRTGRNKRVVWRILPDCRMDLTVFEYSRIMLHALYEDGLMRIDQLALDATGKHWFVALEFWRAFAGVSPMHVPVETQWKLAESTLEANEKDLKWSEEMCQLQKSISLSKLTLGGVGEV